MLPRKLRLSRAHFAPSDSSKGPETRAASPHFSVTRRVTEPGKGGASAVVAKKVEKTSVGRHRLKRRIRAVLVEYAVTATALIVYARSGAGALPFSVLEAELRELLSRVCR
jgi:ribonuclease P protein component